MNLRNRLRMIIGAGGLAVLLGVGGLLLTNESKEYKDNKWIKYPSIALVAAGSYVAVYGSRYVIRREQGKNRR